MRLKILDFRFKNILPFLLLPLYFILPFSVHAQNLGPEAAGPREIQAMVQRVIGLSAGLVFIALTGMLFYAGIKYITSNGEPKQIQLAHNTVTWAILGIVFLVLAWLILKLIEVFTGVPVTKFCIGLGTYCP